VGLHLVNLIGAHSTSIKNQSKTELNVRVKDKPCIAFDHELNLPAFIVGVCISCSQSKNGFEHGGDTD
jgi:hypothetical protein